MKKNLIKIWGIGLALVLVFTLLFSAVPVSAGTLSWGSEDLPDEFVDNFGDDIVDMEVSGDGSTIYATAGGTDNTSSYGVIYRSSNGGESWSTIQVHDDTDTLTPAFVAVAPDDPNYIAVAASNSEVMISSDAGANWDTLGLANGSTNFTVWDLEISVEKGGNHFVAVCGVDTNDNDGEVHSYEIGAIGSNWDEISADTGYASTPEVAAAVAFSPNFYSDQVLVAVTEDDVTDALELQVYSYNQGNWNSGAFSDFPADLIQDTPSDLASIQAASIAMAPDYLGSDEDMRVLFVGLAVDGGTGSTETDGIFRLDNDDVTTLRDEKSIYSVAFDGALLVAGRYDDVDIYRSTNALDDSPSTSGSTGSREPGGTGMVIVGIAGDTVVAGTSGDESAFAYSEDNGATFNDLSLIDTWINTLSDVAVTADGDMTYLITCDGSGVDLSLWYYDSRWERIYSNQSADNDFIIRQAPDDPDVLYMADTGATGTDIYFSSDSGMGKWHTRVYKESTGVVDMAVEGDGDTVYVLTTSGYVSKSTNRGFTWASKVSSKLDNSQMIMSMGEDNVLATSQNGRVAYTTDGNSSWTKISSDGFDDSGDVFATATGLSDGDFVIAGCDSGVYAWELGSDDEWDDISPSALSGNTTSGIGLWDGVLYVIADDGTDSVLVRTLTPTDDDPTWSSVESDGETFDQTPQALKLSAGSTMLWAIDTTGAALFTYKDTLGTVGVEMSLPADDADVPFNTVSGSARQIIFTWNSPSDKVTKFNFEIATDSGFNEDVLSLGIEKSSGTWDEGATISQIVGPGASGDANIQFNPETTYYWRVRVDAAGPVRSAWSDVRSFTTGALPEVQPPVIITQEPPPTISVPEFPPITIEPPEIVLPAPQPVPSIVIPSAPEPTPPVPSWAIYAIIIIGAILVIALIVLIMRTRRPM
jgi:photosystem II stability/assembly factor-like uncharacterized protein